MRSDEDGAIVDHGTRVHGARCARTAIVKHALRQDRKTVIVEDVSLMALSLVAIVKDI